jgi:tetratricopeptide (TPR) repeat protein
MRWENKKGIIELTSAGSTMEDSLPASELMQNGLVHHQAGRLQEAEAIYQSILQEQPQHPDALHLLGVIAHQVGKNEIAVNLIENAIKINPIISDYYNNCGEAYRALQKNDLAIARYEQALAIKPDYAVAHNNLGNTLLDLGRLEDAIAHYEQALAIKPHFAEAHNNLGTTLQKLNRMEEAIACYEQALTIKPDHAVVHNNLGFVLQKLGRQNESIAHYEQALAIKPDYVEAYNNLGNVFTELGRHGEAIARYEKAIIIKPDYVDAYINIGELYEKLNQVKKASFYVQKVLQIQPDEPKSNRLAAVLLRREGKYEEALEILMAIPLINIDTKTEQSIHFEMGKLYDLINDSESAMRHFTKGNYIQANNYESMRFNKNIYLNEVNKIRNQFNQEWLQSWSELILDDKDNSIIFLVGFPRSGTTLLDQILDSHPSIQVIEERPMINKIIDKLSDFHGGYPKALTSLNKSDIKKLRNEYFAQIEENIEKQDNSIIIDKLPLNIIHVGLIYRLFPTSKIILALRHPCDVCLSNFMQIYEINHAMANYFTLEDTAEVYDTVMGLWRIYVDSFPLNYIDVKYESLVDNLESEVKRLLNFLGLVWDPLILDYINHAKSRERIKTPSYSQVTKPIYHNAKYRWHRYKEHLMPIMNKLETHINYFEY